MSLLAGLFREKVSKLKDFNMKNEVEFPVGYSTGFLAFDFRNGSIVHTIVNDKPTKYCSVGITDGSMVMVIGRSGCGKTTWTIQAASNIIRPFKTSCIFHDDIEGGIAESRKEILSGFYGKELTDRYISRNTGITVENFYERVKMIYDIKMNNREDFEYDTSLYDTKGNRIYKLEPTVYILDSLSLLIPEKLTNEDELSGQMSTTATAKAIAQTFRRIIPMLKSANIILFIINHINQKVELNAFARTKSQVSYLKQGETLPGGNTPVYLSNTMIRFDDHSKLKEEETFGIDGTLVDLTLVKSRTSKAGKSVTLIFNQEIGYDKDLSLFLMLKNAKLVNGAGAYLYLGDRSDIKFSQKKFKEKLAESEELREVFKQLVIEHLTEELEDFNMYQQINNASNITSDILSDLCGISA